MKKFLLLSIALLFTLTLIAQKASNETNIQQITEGETPAFAKANLATWFDYFIHPPYAGLSVSPKMHFDEWGALYNGTKSFSKHRQGIPKVTRHIPIFESLERINRNGKILCW